MNPRQDGIEELIYGLARYIAEHGNHLQRRAAELQQAQRDAETILRTLKAGSLMDFANMAPVSGLAVLTVCALLDEDVLQKAKGLLSNRNRAAAEKRHAGAGGSREKRRLIREAWASGKYSSREECAERLHAKLGMSFSTARKALRNTAAPQTPA